MFPFHNNTGLAAIHNYTPTAVDDWMMTTTTSTDATSFSPFDHPQRLMMNGLYDVLYPQFPMIANETTILADVNDDNDDDDVVVGEIAEI